MTTQNLYALTDTWDAGATTFTAIKMDVTDTASAAGSLLMDLQVGGASRFRVVKNARTTASSWELDDGYLSGYSSITGAMARTLTQRTLLIDSGGSNIYLNATGSFGFTASAGGTDVGTSFDTVLRRDAADTLAQRRGTNAQAFRVYNTYTDASNYERGIFRWVGNFLETGTEAAGTGTARSMLFSVGGATKITINTADIRLSDDLLFTTDNTHDIGAAAATRPRNVYVGSLLVSPEVRASSSFALRSGSIGVSLNYVGDGVTSLTALSGTDFGRLQFGGTTSSFPSLKRSSTTLQARLADDSAFAPVQGKLTTETAYTAGDPVTTGYLTLYDSNGTAYKVPAVAA